MDKPAFYCRFAGSIPFAKSLQMQEGFKKQAFKQKQLFFLGFEPIKPVISLGIRSDASHIVWSEEKQIKNEISVQSVRRGGEATLHAPGQLVIYPVLHLPSAGLKIRDYITALEHISQAFFKALGITTFQQGKYAGLYTKKGKLCFFGIHVSQGVSQHGLSINVDNDLSLFNSIKSCGVEKRTHDSLSCYLSLCVDKKKLFLSWCDKAKLFFQPRSIA